jgi:anion-transporting  ArsA/GET3 family ATPase
MSSSSDRKHRSAGPPLGTLIADRKLVVCVGSGGVGKTTTAAAIGLQAAIRGRKVLVLTIDPARRLANSLGLSRFGNDETRIDLSALPEAKGELWAMMLDQQKTFDDLIARIAPDDERRDAILNNRVYRATADNISGSQDYMATEKLYDVVESGRYELVVLDTPPVKNALDFLDAPGRLARFLDKRVMKWFLSPYDKERVFGRLLTSTSAVVFRLLSHVFGREFLDDLAEYFQHFRDLYDGFRERQEAVVEMFHDRQRTSFLIVCAPNGPSSEVARFFLDELRERRMPNPGVIVNQRHLTLGEKLDARSELGSALGELSGDLSSSAASSLAARLGAAHRRMLGLSAAEGTIVGSLLAALQPHQKSWQVPRLDDEVNDLAGLARVGACLFEPAEP